MSESILNYGEEITKLIEGYRTISETGIDIMDEGIITIRSENNNVFITKKKHIKNGSISGGDLVTYSRNSVNNEVEYVDPRFYAHLSFMQQFPQIRSVVTLNARNSCIWSSTGLALPPISFFHAENFFGEIMCTDSVDSCGSNKEMFGNLGKLVGSLFKYKKIEHYSAAFVKDWAGWTWGNTLSETINRYLVLEECCQRALQLGMAKGLLFEYLPYNVTEFFNSDVINEIQ